MKESEKREAQLQEQILGWQKEQEVQRAELEQQNARIEKLHLELANARTERRICRAESQTYRKRNPKSKGRRKRDRAEKAGKSGCHCRKRSTDPAD